MYASCGRMRAHTQTHTCMQTHKHTRACRHTDVHADRHACRQTNTHVHADRQTHTCMQTDSDRQTTILVSPVTSVFVCLCLCLCVCVCACVCACVRACVCSQIVVSPLTRTLQTATYSFAAAQVCTCTPWLLPRSLSVCRFVFLSGLFVGLGVCKETYI